MEVSRDSTDKCIDREDRLVLEKDLLPRTQSQWKHGRS